MEELLKKDETFKDLLSKFRVNQTQRNIEIDASNGQLFEASKQTEEEYSSSARALEDYLHRNFPDTVCEDFHSVLTHPWSGAYNISESVKKWKI